MKTLKELIEQRAALDTQITSLTKEHRSDAIEQIRALMRESGLSVADLGGAVSRVATVKTSETRKVAAKYRDNMGNAWSGRGLTPKWLKAELEKGAKVEDFAV